MTLQEIFGAQNELSLGQECARAALIFFYGLLLVRIAGRRIFAKWSALDIVVAIIAGSNLSRALTGTAPLWGTIVATTLLVALHWGLARLSALSPVVSRFLEGRPIVVGEHGSLSHGALLRCGLSANDLFEAFRQKELTAESDTRLVIMEPNGKLSVFKK